MWDTLVRAVTHNLGVCFVAAFLGALSCIVLMFFIDPTYASVTIGTYNTTSCTVFYYTYLPTYASVTIGMYNTTSCTVFY